MHAASRGRYSGGSLSAGSIGGGGDATWRSATGHVGDPGDVEQRGGKGSGGEGPERLGGWRDASVEANEWNGESAEANEWQGESVVVYKTRSGLFAIQVVRQESDHALCLAFRCILCLLPHVR